MHLYLGKKKIIVLLLLVLFFLSSINSQLFVKKKNSLFNLNSIKVIGLEKSINLKIEKDLDFLLNSNVLFIDKQILIDQLNKYNFIEKYNISKLYPSKILLKLEKTDFLARAVRNNKIFIVGANGKFIEIDKFNNYEKLPLIFGKFTADKFIPFIKILNKSNLNYNNIKEIFFFPSGRINIKDKNNLMIKLPVENLEEALSIASKVINNKSFNNNVIDLRVSNQLILYDE
tara:strand:- start:763 stop:1452 length:690 start_codon:yes stop_codon:yes gene_type:complete